MNPYQSTPETLRIGYSTRTKIAVAVAATVGWLLAYSLLTGELPLYALLPGTLGLISTLFVVVTLRGGYTMHRSALHHTTWSGRRTYSRASFLGAELVDDTRGKPGLLLRFQGGVLLLAESRDCSDPVAVQQYLERHWQVSLDAPRLDHAGPVNENIVMDYESVHLFWLGLGTIGFAALSALGQIGRAHV